MRYSVGFFVLILFSSPGVAGFDDGVAAFEKGNYELAWDELYPRALEGDARAEYFVGNMYHLGLGVAKNLTEASKWYRRSANQNYPSAQNNLGYMYVNGEGVKQDIAEAIRLFQRAADNGVYNSMYSLAWIYNGGYGVHKDLIKSLKWLTILKWIVVPGKEYANEAAKGNAIETSYIDKIYDHVRSQMNSEQIEISRQLAVQWMKEHELSD